MNKEASGKYLDIVPAPPLSSSSSPSMSISSDQQQQHSLPSQPQYAQIRARHRPSPKGEHRLWLYQCAVKSCSKGEKRISGTSRPKGRDVPPCDHCGGKLHWKGTERDPGTGQSGYNAPDGNASTSSSSRIELPTPPGRGSGSIRGSLSPQPPQAARPFPSNGFAPVNYATRSLSPQPPPQQQMMNEDFSSATPSSTDVAMDASPSANSQENRGGRPWEL